MELIGRSIDEGETVHGADWNSLWWSAVGAGTIIPTGEMCEPEISVIEDGYHRGVRVKGGRVLHDGDVYSVEEDEVKLMNNLGNEERYDVVFLKLSNGDVVLDAKMGDPSEEEALHPELLDDTEEVITPIAVVFLDKDATDITQLKDVRSVPNEKHLHQAGKGLYFDENYEANVSADEDTIKIVSDELTLGSLGGHELDLEDGKGIDYYEYWDEETEEWKFIYRLDDGNGLGIGDEDELKVIPSEITGAGLEVDNDKIDVTAGDGLKIEERKLAARVGQGTKISDGKLAADAKDGRGAAAEPSGIEVITSDLAGSGLGTEDENLKVNAGDGLQLNGDLIEVAQGEGIKEIDGKIGLALQEDGGLGIEDEQLYADPGEVSHAGSGLYEDSDTDGIHVGEGGGIGVSTYSAHVNTGDGTRLNDGMVEAHVDFYGGIELDSDLSVDPGDIDGEGLTESDGDLHVKTGDGVKISGDHLTLDLEDVGGFRKGDELEVEPSDFAGNYAKDWMKIEDDQIEIAPEDMFKMIGEKVVTITSTGQREGIWFEDYTTRYPVVMGIAYLDQAPSLTDAAQVKKVMEDHNSESGYYGNDFFAGVECVGSIGGGEPDSAEILIRVYEVQMDSSWIYEWDQ